MTRGVLARNASSFLRLAIAGILASTAAGKLLDVRGFADVLRSYETFPAGALLPIALAVAASEGLLAVWLSTGRRLSGAAASATAMHAAYGAFSAVTLARGIRPPNCGCFGIFLARPLTWATVAEDAGLAAISLALWQLARRSA